MIFSITALLEFREGHQEGGEIGVEARQDVWIRISLDYLTCKFCEGDMIATQQLLRARFYIKRCKTTNDHHSNHAICNNFPP